MCPCRLLCVQSGVADSLLMVLFGEVIETLGAGT